MSKYIGTPVVNLSVDTVDVTGDITTTDSTPEVIIVNDTHEDTDGGREGKLTFKGQASGGEETTLAQIQASHDGTSDDEKGDLIFKTNDGSDGASPTERMRIDSSGDISFYESTGTTPKFVFDASTESLSLTTVGTEALDISSTTGAAEIRMGNSNSTFDLRFGAADKASGHADFFVETGGSERMRIDSNGKVGIGGSPTSRNVEVIDTNPTLAILSDSTSGTGQLLFGDPGDDNIGRIYYGHTDNEMRFYTNASERMRIDSTGAVILNNSGGDAQIYMGGNSGTNRMYLARSGSDSLLWNVSSGDMKFGTNNTERMRLDNSGRAFINTTTDLIAVLNMDNQSGDYCIGLRDTAENSAFILFKNSASASIGSILRNGSSGVSFNTTSDYRLKENIVDISNGIERVKQLAPKRFNFIEEPDRTVDGFLAHEAQAVVAEAVHGTKDQVEVWVEGEELPDGVSVGDNKLDDGGKTIPKMQGIDQAKLVPLLTAALQEAIAKIETLETKVAALEGE